MIDARGIVTHACPQCEGIEFLVIATFDDYEIATWSLDGTCTSCGSQVTVPCPLDRPEIDCV